MGGILWLSSYPKSGNTWLRAYLANLFQNPPRPIPINELANHALADNFLIHYERFSGKQAEDLTPEDIVALRPRVHEWFARSGSDTTFVKTHIACALVDGRPLITPSATAGAVYVVRNPFDVAASFANHYQIPAQRAVDQLCSDETILPGVEGQLEQLIMSWSSHVKSWTRADMRLHLMSYEDMLARPFETFGALSRFLGLPEEPERIKQAVEFSSFRELKTQEEKSGFVEARPDGAAKFFREGKAGGWRDVLTEQQAAQLIEAHGAVMAEHGYLTKDGKHTV